MDISTGWPSLISTHGYIHGYPYPRQPWKDSMERKFLDFPRNESSTGAKVLSMVFSLPGTKVQRNEKASYHKYCLVIGMFNGQFRFSENLMYEKIFAKIIFADSIQWPVCNYLLCNRKDSSHCN